MNILVAGDSFKGSLSSKEFTQTTAEILQKNGISARALPLSDGGEGALQVLTDILDIGTLTAQDIINLCGGVPDVIWASPDCTTYSVAAISKHRWRDWDGNLCPLSDYAQRCDEINRHLIALIQELNPKYYFIENPVGGLRKMNFMQGIPRHTVTYCQYGERRQKPTDIWTNHPAPGFKEPCKRGAPCHDAAPRGARTGTQSLKNRIEKARIPVELCEHIVDICEK